jgi:dTDP-4-amino-4,6-dideoxygalactose transaminase
MIPYYSPNFGIKDLLLTVLNTKPDLKLVRYFQELTGKKYILITSSCRGALYLAYMSLNQHGLVHVSPLTCQVALLPITASGNQIRFDDIKKEDWTLDPDSVERSVGENSLAIQAIHLGGFPCDMPALRQIADKNGLVLIEDCAQGFGATYLGTNVGTLGDISCFTLTKNVYGLGGGIFATDNHEYYEKARILQVGFKRETNLRILYRILNALISTDRNNEYGDKIHAGLQRFKRKHIENSGLITEDILKKELKLTNHMYTGSVSGRLNIIKVLNEIRTTKAKQIIKMLEPLGFRFQKNDFTVSSYTKLFCMHERIESDSFIKHLNQTGLEAMHLEHKHGVHYQPKMTSVMKNNTRSGLVNYESVHDHLLSIPLYECIKAQDLECIRDILVRNLP